MLTLIILLILAYSFYTGFRRGLVMQVVQLIGYIVTFILATKYFEPLSEYVEMIVPFPSVQQNSNLIFYNEAQSFFLDKAFYRAITFIVIWLIGWIVTKFLAVFFTKITYYNVLNHVNHIVGGIINVLVTYCVIYMVLFILSLIPMEFVQQQFVDNPMIYRIVSDTPVLSDWAATTWLEMNPFN